MATLETGTTLKQPLTSTVTLKNSVEILTRKTTYMKNTSEATGRLTGREEWERESATIRKKAQLIRYDQQTKQTKHCYTSYKVQIPEWPPRMSRTAIGDDRWPTCSILTLPKLHLATFKLITNDELGSWCLKGWWVAKCSEQRGGIHGNPGNGNHPRNTSPGAWRWRDPTTG